MRNKIKPQTDAEREICLNLAVQDVQEGISQRQAAKLRGVPRTTLQERLKGRQDYQTAHIHEQKLSEVEEAEVVCWCLQMERQFLPVRPLHIIDCAEAILRKRSGDVEITLGHHWIERFMARHPQLRVTTSKRIDQRRVMAKNPGNIMEFYVLFSNTKDKHDIPPRRTFNMDEKGYLMGMTGGEKVVIFVRDNPDGRAGGAKHYGNRETITTIDCIGGSGTVLPTFIIMKGKNVMSAWAENSPLDLRTKWACSPNGWTSDVLGVEWLKAFNEWTQDTLDSDDDWRCLILDGHRSHLTYNFLQYAIDHRIMVLGLPSHTTDILQPLDVGIFGPLQHYYSQAVANQMRKRLAVTKSNFSTLLHEARSQAYTEENILSAFEATGICPLDPYRTAVMKEFLAKARGQHEKTLDQIRLSQNEQAATIEQCRKILKNKDANPSLVLETLAKLLRVSEAQEARNTIMENELDNLRHAIKEKTQKKSKNIRLGRARVWTQEEIVEEHGNEARARNASSRGRGRGRGKTNTGTRNEDKRGVRRKERRRKASIDDEGSSQSDFIPESEDSA